MKKMQTSIILLSLLMLTLSISMTDASDYGDMKSQAKEGRSKIFDAFVSEFAYEKRSEPVQYNTNQLNDLIEKYKSASHRNPLDGILEILPNLNRNQIEEYKGLRDSDVIYQISDEISEDEIISIVIARSSRISKAENSWHASLKLYPQTQYLQDLLKAYMPFTEGITLGVGKEYQQEMIQMYYPSPGMQTLRGQVVEIDIESAWLEYLKEVLNVVSDTRSLLSEIKLKDEMITINKESVYLLNILHDVSEVQYKAGTRSFADLIRLETELEKRKDTVERLKSMQKGLHAKLLAAMDLPVDSQLGNIEYAIDLYPDLNNVQLQNELVTSNQELKQLALKVQKMGIMIEMTNLRSAPDLTFGFTYFQDRKVQSLNKSDQSMAEMDSDMDGMLISSSDESMDMSTMNFMNKPMIDYRKSNFATDLAWAAELVDRKKAMEEMLEAKTEMAQGMLSMLYEKYQQMFDSGFVFTKKVIPAAEAALKVSRTGYSADENDFNDLIGSELALEMARMELANINHERRLALIEIERLVGKTLREQDKESTFTNQMRGETNEK